MDTSQFGGPSAIAVIDGTLILFRGGDADSDRQSIQVMTAEVPAASIQNGNPVFPSFSDAQLCDTGGGPIQGGNIGQCNVSTAPVALTVDENTIELIYCNGPNVYGQSFTIGTAGVVRTRPEFQYATTNSNGMYAQTTAMSTVPGDAAYIVAYNWFDGTTGGIRFDYYRHDDASTPGAYFSMTLSTIPVLTDSRWTGEMSMAIVRNPNATPSADDQTPPWPYQILLVFRCGSAGFYLGSINLSADLGQGPTMDTSSFQLSQFMAWGMNALSVHRGPDGIACMMAVDCYYGDSGTLHFFPVTCVDPTGLSFSPEMKASAYTHLTQVPAVFYTCGAFESTQQQPIVPVWRTTMFDVSSGEVMQTVTARRTTLPSSSNLNPSGVLVGIIEGGPPVDNTSVAKYTATLTTVGSMEYSSEADQETDTSYSPRGSLQNRP